MDRSTSIAANKSTQSNVTRTNRTTGQTYTASEATIQAAFTGCNSCGDIDWVQIIEEDSHPPGTNQPPYFDVQQGYLPPYYYPPGTIIRIDAPVE